jgi:hypothetical protein
MTLLLGDQAGKGTVTTQLFLMLLFKAASEIGQGPTHVQATQAPWHACAGMLMGDQRTAPAHTRCITR